LQINEDKTIAICCSHRIRPTDSLLTLNGRDIPFVNSVKHLCVIKEITWRLHIETIEAKAFRTFIGIYPLFKSERLGTNSKSSLHEALIRSMIIYACPTWEFAAETHLLKLQRLQSRVLRTIGNFPRRSSIRDMHVAFQVPYFYDYVTKLCRRQAEIIHNHENENVRNIGQGETPHKKYKRLKRSCIQPFKCLRLSWLRVLLLVGHKVLY
jgi:hypothetical protein